MSKGKEIVPAYPSVQVATPAYSHHKIALSYFRSDRSVGFGLSGAHLQ